MTMPLSLSATVQAAIDRANLQGRSILLSYSRPWEYADLLTFLSHYAGEFPFFWLRGQGEFCAADRVFMLSAKGSSRFLSLGQQLQEHLQHYICGGVVALPPHFVGGFSFYHEGDSQFWLPGWMIHRQGEQAYACLFDRVSPQATFAQVYTRLERRLDRLMQRNTGSLKVPLTIPCPATQEAASQWAEVVNAALEAIQQRKFQKVVLARLLEVVAERPLSPFAGAAQLRVDHPDCTVFLMGLGQDKTFLGATPEMLLEFSWQSDRLLLRSDAVAGSAPRGRSAQEDQDWGEYLLHSPKDNAEHQMVVRSIQRGYAGTNAVLCLPSVPILLKLHHIQHLYTPITASWQTDRWEQVFRILSDLHPTAAVGGEPRDQALSFIRQVEPFDREGYAAPVGWVNGAGAGGFAVAIRSGYIQGNRARIFAGAGIVADSQVEREWEETTLKLQALLRAIGIQESLAVSAPFLAE